MKPVLVVYATREGQTRHIAEHLGAALVARQNPSAVLDAAHIPPGFTLTDYAGAMVCASLHMGKHEPEMVRFVKRHLAELQRIPTVFLSVSLAEAGVEDAHATPERVAEARAHVQRTTENFLTETGWRPGFTAAAAGALRYSQYNFVTRFIMKRIATKTGMPTDTVRDYEFTDWTKVDRLMAELIEGIPAEAGARG